MICSNELLVVEYAGTPRSGKGTIVGHQTEASEGIAAEETGADYRAITAALLLDSLVEPDMQPDAVQRIVTARSVGELTDMVARRPEFIREHGKDSLHTDTIDGLVGLISPLPHVRTAVKDGFKQRVQQVVRGGEAELLLVDGRNLAPIFKDMPGVHLLFRSYVTCTAEEATRREVQRNGITNPITINTIHHHTKRRMQLDANRPIDPVRPDIDAIDYWSDSRVTVADSQHAADRIDKGHQVWQAIYDGEIPANSLHPRYGAGELAVKAGLQILFDTTPYGHMPTPKDRMLAAADQMLAEAREAHRAA